MRIKARGFEIKFLDTPEGWLATINNVFHTGCTGNPMPTKKEAALDTLRYFGECFDDCPFPYNDARRIINDLND